jgi:hypothetical protein
MFCPTKGVNANAGAISLIQNSIVSKWYQMKDPEPCKNGQNWWNRPNVLRPMSKRFGPPRLKGSTQEKSTFEISISATEKPQMIRQLPDYWTP